MDKSTFCKQLPTEEYRSISQVSFSDLRLLSIYLGGSPQKYQYYKGLELARQEAEEEGILEPEQQKKAVAFGNAFHMYMADPDKVKILSATGPDESTQTGIFINAVAREERNLYVEKYKNLYPDLDPDNYKEEFLREFKAGYYNKDNEVWKNSASVTRAFLATQSKRYKNADFFLEQLDILENKEFFKALVTYNPETELLVTPEVRQTLQRSIDNLKNHNFYKYLYNEGDTVKLSIRETELGKVFTFSVFFRELQIVCKEIKGTIDNLRVDFTLTEQDGLRQVLFSISDYKTNYSSAVDYLESNKGDTDILQLCFYQHLIRQFILEQEENLEDIKNVFIKRLFDSVKEEYLKTSYLQEEDEVQKKISYFLGEVEGKEVNPQEFLSFVSFESTIFHIQTSGKYNPVTPIRFVGGEKQNDVIDSSMEEYYKMKEQKGDYNGFVIDFNLEANYAETVYMKDLSEIKEEPKPNEDENEF
jgi:hypothetical protein